MKIIRNHSDYGPPILAEAVNVTQIVQNGLAGAGGFFLQILVLDDMVRFLELFLLPNFTCRSILAWEIRKSAKKNLFLEAC